MFIDEAPWLWRACWLTDDYLMGMMAGGDGGEEMLVMSEFVIPTAGIQLLEPAIPSEPSAAEQIARLTKSIIFLERIRLEYPDFQDEIDVEAWYEFMDALYQELVDLYMGNY